MSGEPASGESSRRELLARSGALLAAASLSALPHSVEAKDYTSRREALDDLDRLASSCAARLDAVRLSRASADLLARRFTDALRRHRATRDDVRRRFALSGTAELPSPPGSFDGDLTGLRQALDDLMLAYAESLPVFADAAVVSSLAVDMVEVSKLRTVIDLWVESESL